MPSRCSPAATAAQPRATPSACWHLHTVDSGLAALCTKQQISTAKGHPRQNLGSLRPRAAPAAWAAWDSLEQLQTASDSRLRGLTPDCQVGTRIQQHPEGGQRASLHSVMHRREAQAGAGGIQAGPQPKQLLPAGHRGDSRVVWSGRAGGPRALRRALLGVCPPTLAQRDCTRFKPPMDAPPEQPFRHAPVHRRAGPPRRQAPAGSCPQPPAPPFAGRTGAR